MRVRVRKDTTDKQIFTRYRYRYTDKTEHTYYIWNALLLNMLAWC